MQHVTNAMVRQEASEAEKREMYLKQRQEQAELIMRRRKAYYEKLGVPDTDPRDCYEMLADQLDEFTQLEELK